MLADFGVRFRELDQSQRLRIISLLFHWCLIWVFRHLLIPPSHVALGMMELKVSLEGTFFLFLVCVMRHMIKAT